MGQQSSTNDMPLLAVFQNTDSSNENAVVEVF